MIRIESDDTDAAEMVGVVKELIVGAIKASGPESVFVVKIDNWFGRKWLHFNRTVMGAFGVATTDLVVPPFVPNRVVVEQFLAKGAAGSFAQEPAPEPLHRRQASSENVVRRIAQLFPRTAMFWWSGGSKKNGRGSVMGYVPTSDGHCPWYIELSEPRGWAPGPLLGISEAEIEQLRQMARPVPSTASEEAEDVPGTSQSHYVVVERKHRTFF